MDILPNLGIGEVRFGMSASEVEAILGPSLPHEEDWMAAASDICYPGLMLRFRDYRGNPRRTDTSKLIEICVHRDFIKLPLIFRGEPFFSLTWEYFEQLIERESIPHQFNREWNELYLSGHCCIELLFDEVGTVHKAWLDAPL